MTSDNVVLGVVVVIVQVLVDGEERDVFPGGVADGADKDAMAADMGSYAREVKGVATLRRVNGGALAGLDAVQAYPAATLQ